jgi:hypothetical protein
VNPRVSCLAFGSPRSREQLTRAGMWHYCLPVMPSQHLLLCRILALSRSMPGKPQAQTNGCCVRETETPALPISIFESVEILAEHYVQDCLKRQSMLRTATARSLHQVITDSDAFRTRPIYPDPKIAPSTCASCCAFYSASPPAGVRCLHFVAARSAAAKVKRGPTSG